MPPTLRHGKICYVEIPAADVLRSATFYHRALGWRIHERGDGAFSFEDAVNEVSGTWVRGRKPQVSPGLLLYILVDDVVASLEAVLANGGRAVRRTRAHAPELSARFRDPAGNVLGLCQKPDSPQPEGDRPPPTT
jgi:uncharacterized protein